MWTSQSTTPVKAKTSAPLPNLPPTCVVLSLQPTPGVGNAVAGYAARFSTTKRAEPKGSNPRPVGKVRCHLGLGKQVEKGDQKVESVIYVWGLLGSGLKGIETEPTGVEFSFTNFIPLPYPFWGSV